MVLKAMDRGDYFFQTIIMTLILRYIPTIAIWAIPLVIEIVPDVTLEELLMLGLDLEPVLGSIFTGVIWYMIAFALSVFTILKWTIYRLRDVGVTPLMTLLYVPFYMLYITGSLVEQIIMNPLAATLGFVILGGPLLVLLLLPQDYFRAASL